MGVDKVNCLFDIKFCVVIENEGIIYLSLSYNKYEGVLKVK